MCSRQGPNNLESDGEGTNVRGNNVCLRCGDAEIAALKYISLSSSYSVTGVCLLVTLAADSAVLWAPVV